jgi:hypothetical protein
LKQVSSDILKAIQDQGFNPENFNDPMHYKIPDYNLGNSKIKLPDPEGLDQWIKFRSLANEAVFMFAGYFQASPDARIWPHHFDTGMYKQVNEKIGLGFGLAMKDSLVGEPYFYLSGYSGTEAIDYSDVPEIKSEWIISENWKGAILRLADFSDDSNYNRKLVSEFITKVVNWYLKS